ncbi:hypothetical protein [Paracidovorax wautersii]|uniref:hypothetical protein n=1 Tax=Paracidovorax wautersii TaxID=1177982 RepID=UPI0031E156FB
MRVPANCLLAALTAKLLHPRTVRLVFARNRARRWHCTWQRNGQAFEFHAPGRSRLPYWRNALYLGEVRQIGGRP